MIQNIDECHFSHFLTQFFFLMHSYADIVECFSSDSEEMLKKGMEKLHENQSYIIGPKNDKLNYLSTLLRAFEKRPQNISQDQWDQYRFIVYFSCAHLALPEYQLSLDSLETTWGPLLNAFCYYCKVKQKKPNHISFYLNKFNEYIREVVNRKENPPFHTRSIASDMRYFPHAFDQDLSKKDIYRYFQEIDPQKLSEADINIFYELLQKIKTTDHAGFIPFTKFFSFPGSPTYLLDRFFKSWFHLINASLASQSGALHQDTLESISVVVKLFQNSTKYKYHEISSPNFNWKTILFLFRCVSTPQLQGKIISFFVFATRNITMNISIQNAKQTAQFLSDIYLKQQIGSYYTYYIHSLISSLASISEKLLKTKVPSLVLPSYTTSKLYFIDQVPESKGLLHDSDSFLYTKLNLKIVNSQEELIEEFRKATKKLEMINRNVATPLKMTIENLRVMYEQLKAKNPDGETPIYSSLFYALNRAVEELIQLLFVISLKITEQDFCLSQISEKFKNEVPNTNDHFYNIYQRFGQQFFVVRFDKIKLTIAQLFEPNGIPKEYENIIARHILNSLFSGLVNERASVTFCKYFNEIIKPNTSMYNLIIEKMLFKMLGLTHLLTSPILNEGNLLVAWFTFFVRIVFCDSMKNQRVGKLLQLYKRAIVDQTLTHPKNISNQTCLSFLLENYISIISLNNKNAKLLPISTAPLIRQLMIDNVEKIRPYIRETAIRNFMHQDAVTIMQGTYFPLLQTALRTKTSDILHKTAEVLLEIMRDPRGKLDPESDDCRNLLSMWYKQRKYCPNVDIVKMGETINYSKYSFLYRPKTEADPIDIIFEPVGVSFYSFMQAIFSSLTEDYDEAKHILALCQLAYEFIAEEYVKNVRDTRFAKGLQPMIMTMDYLSRFPEIRGKLLDIFTNLTELFLDPFCEGHSNFYILTLFQTYGSSPPKANNFIEMIIERFLAKTTAKVCPDFVIEQLIKDLLEREFGIYWFSITLNGINFIHKYYPHTIKTHHILKMVQLTWSFLVMDDIILKDFSQFLKRFEQGLSPEGKLEYLMEIYNMTIRIHPMFMLTLYKRLKKLKIPLEITDFDEFRTLTAPDLYLFRASLIFACGTTIGPMPREEVFRLQKQLMKGNMQQKTQERTLYIMCYNAILENQENADLFFNDHNSRQMISVFFIKFAAQTAFPFLSLMKLGYNCLRLITTRFASDTQLINLITENANHENFFYIFCRAIPFFCKTQLIRTYVLKIKEFSEFSSEQRLLSFQVFNKYFKGIGSEEMFKVPNSRETITETHGDQQSLLSIVISSFLKLIPSHDIPFWPTLGKYVTTFCTIFHKPVTRLLFSPEFITLSSSSCLMEHLILHDKTNQFAQDLFQIMAKVDDYSIFPIAFQRIFYKMTELQHYRSNIAFNDLIQSIFTKLLSSFESTQFANEYSVPILLTFAKTYFNLIKYSSQLPEPRNFIQISSLFLYHDFKSSEAYQIYKNVFYRGGEEYKKYYQRLISLVCSELNEINPRQFDIILSNCIKYSMLAESTVTSVIWENLMKDYSLGNPEHYSAIAHIIRILLQKDYNIYDLYAQEWLKYLPSIYSSSNTDLIVETTRSLAIFGQKRRIPEELFIETTRHFFLNSHLLEFPFVNHAIEFFKTRKDIMNEKCPYSIIETINIFLNDRMPILGLKGFISKLFLEFPNLVKYLPFSVHAIMANSNWNVIRKNQPMGNAFVYGIQFVTDLPVTSPQDYQQYFAICIEYMKRYLKDKNSVFNQNTQIDVYLVVHYPLLSYLMKKPPQIPFPDDLIKECSNQDEASYDSLHFIIAICMLFFSSQKMIESGRDFVRKLLLNISTIFPSNNGHVELANYFMRMMIKGIMNLPFYDEKYQKNLLEIFIYYYKQPHLISKTTVLLEEICRGPGINHAIFYTEALRLIRESKKQNYTDILSYHILTLIENMHCIESQDNQLEFFSSIFSKSPNRLEFIKPLLTALPSLIADSKLSVYVRLKIIETCPKILHTVGKESKYMFDIIVDALFAFAKETGQNITEQIIIVLCLQAFIGTSTCKVRCAQKIREILPDAHSPSSCFLFLKNTLPISFWKNEKLSFLINIILPRTKETDTLTALFPLYREANEGLCRKMIQAVLNQETENEIRRFLWSILSLKGKEFKHSHLVRSIVQVFNDSQYELQFEYVKKASNATALQYELSQYMGIETTEKKFIFPGDQNGLLFGKIVNALPNNDQNALMEQAASLLFMIGEYESSMEVFSKIDTPSSLPIIRSIHDYCVQINEVDPNDFTHPYRDINSTKNNVILDSIRNLAKAIKDKNQQEYTKLISNVEIANLNYMKMHSQLQDWQRHLIIYVQQIVHMAKNIVQNKSPHPFSISQFHFHQFGLQNLFLKELNIKPPFFRNEIEETNESSEVVILPIQIIDKIKSIAGYTKNGDVAVTVPSVELYLKMAIQQINSGKSSITTLILLSNVLYELFVNSPSSMLFTACFDMITKNSPIGESTGLWNILSISQLFSMMKIASVSNDSIISISAQKTCELIQTLNPQVKEKLLYHAPYIVLSQNQYFKMGTRDLNKKLEYYTALFTHKKEEFLERSMTLKRDDHQNERRVSFLLKLEQFFDVLFTIDWATYSIQMIIKEFILETCILPDDFQFDSLQSIKESFMNSESKSEVHISASNFEKLVFKLPDSLINAITDFAAFKQNCLNHFNEFTVDNFVQELFPSSEGSFIETREKILSLTNNINSYIHLFPQNHFMTKQWGSSTIHRALLPDIEMVDENTLLIPTLILSSNPKDSKQFFTVQKTTAAKNNKLNPSTLIHITNILLHVVSSKSNALFPLSSLGIAINNTMEIGPNYIITFYASRPHFMTRIFQEYVGIGPSQWEPSEENIAKLPVDCLRQKFVNSLTPQSFYKLKMNFIHYLSTQIWIRNMIKAPYPSLSQLAISMNYGEVFSSAPFLVELPETEGIVPFRISPVFQQLIGPECKGQIIHAVTKFSHSLQSIGRIISPLLHLFEFDRYDVKSLDQLHDNYNTDLDRICLFSPSFNRASNAEDNIAWYEEVNKLIDSAMDPSEKPPESIPWF